MSLFQPLPGSKMCTNLCPWDNSSQVGSTEAETTVHLLCAWWCYWTQGPLQARHHPSHSTSQVWSPKLCSCCVSPSPCAGRRSCYREWLFPVWSLSKPWKHHSCLREQLICTGTPVIKSWWWLHCYPSTTVRKAPHEDYPERFNHVQKLLQSSVAFEACCSLDRQRGKEKELDVERAGWGWPVIAGKHSHTHEPKIKDWHIQSHFVLRICFSWLATWNRVTVTHFVSCTLSAMRDDRSFPAPSFSIKSKGCFAAIYLYFCVKRPWWPKGSEVYSCW